jgi:penicillin-insensitive murein endopeptidase
MGRPSSHLAGAALFLVCATIATSFLFDFSACANVSPAASPAPTPPPIPNTTETNPWSHVTKPTLDPTQSIGEYAAGCLRGAKKIELTGPGYQVMRPSRKRYYGHPLLINFLKDLAQKVQEKGWGDLLIGDMGQARGGPTVGGHASHQIGLDVDIWFVQETDGKILTTKQREELSAPSMVIDDFEGLNEKNWKPQKMDLIKLAALHPGVQRIFVNPVIKRELCGKYKGEAWMTKVRPWWFHQEHFHVRLYCAPGDVTCVPQDETPPGDGCDQTLSDWFTPESKQKEKELRETPGQAMLPTLPALCSEVLKE